jgi:hypothetical protein
MKRVVAALFLFSSGALAQTSEEISFGRTFLLRNAAGTAFNPGPIPRRALLYERGAWTTFLEATAFATYSSESGPEEQRNEAFSTNWLSAGAQRTLGSRGLVLFRGRLSLEPYTIPEEGYPQMLQWLSPENGGPSLDVMRAHDLIGEAAIQLAFRTSTSSFLHVYAAPVGTPAFGALPYALRASSEDFAEAPFNYDVQETVHDATSVVTAGFGSRWISLEASVFHDALTTGPHTTIDSGDIDSRSARITFTPVRNLSLQYSQAELGDAERETTSASIAYGGTVVAASLIWTNRQMATGEELAALAVESAFHLGRSTIAARVETVDRPPGFLGEIDIERTTHFTIGYIFDFLAGDAFRAGVGVTIDYHTQSHELPERYGHKPQALYAFARFRTEPARR